METDFLLTVKGVQNYGEREDSIELTTEASLTGEGGVLFLRYEESELTGLQGTTTTFELRKDKVLLTRRGAVNNEMEFALGQLHQSLYDTGEGALLITIRTTAIEDAMTLEGGTLHVGYDISIENLGMGRIDYWLTVRKRKTEK